MTELLFRQLSYDIVGAAIEVYNRLGPFLQEPVYQKAMEIELGFLGIPYSAKRRLGIQYRGFSVGWGEIDLLVEESIVVELKAASAVHPSHVSQVLQYLAVVELPLGLILNFGNIDKLESRRVPFSQALETLRNRRNRADAPDRVESERTDP